MSVAPRKNTPLSPREQVAPQAPQLPALPQRFRVAAAREIVQQYHTTLTALQAIVPTLPNLAVLITTTDERRRGEIRKALEEGARLAQTEQTERRAVQHLPLGKRSRADVAKLIRVGSDVGKRVTSLVERADELFTAGKGIPSHPALLSAHEEVVLFKAFRQHRERFWTALHMVPFIRDQAVRELREIRDSGVKIAHSIMSPRSKGRTEAQLARHVDANVATVTGMIAREHGKPGLLNSAKIATLLVETPLVSERLVQFMSELVARTEEMRDLCARLTARHRSIGSFAARRDPEYAVYSRRSEELGGTLEHAELQLRTLQALKEPYQRIKDYLVNTNIRLVGKLVNIHERALDNQDELMQDGVIGLMRAIEKFDPGTGLKLSTPATWWIKQAILRKRHGYHHPVAIPVHLMEALSRVALAETEELRPSDSQLSKSLKIEESVVRSLRARSRPLLSIYPQEEEANGIGDILPDEREETVHDGAGQLELRRRIQDMLRRVHPRLADIITKRFGLGCTPMTLDQIARQMGITRERVRQLESKALQKIRQGPLAKMLEDFA